jgi:citrate lyase subunit beta/citryl-CoA lyase
MILRSFLFVPADSKKKLAKARGSAADALILDLEDSVAAENRPKGRALIREFLQDSHRKSIWVRINPLGSEDFIRDVETVVASQPAGFVIPKPEGPHTLNVIDAHILTRESLANLPPGGIKLLPVATESPTAVLSLSDYRSPPSRLAALTWGAEDLAAQLGAAGNRDESGEFLLTFKIVRTLCLMAAKAAGVEAIETLHANFRDTAGLERAARAAQREGFTGMLAIHPDQVETINAAFTPSQVDVEHARKVVAAFQSGAGVVSLDGRMLDQPHLKQAQHILALAERLAAPRPA